MSYYVDFYQHIPIGIDVIDECDNDAIPVGIDVTEECDNDTVPVSIDVTEECDNDNIGIGIDIDSYSTQFFLRCPIGIDVTNPGYMPSMGGVEVIDSVPVVSLPEPSYEEHITKLYAGVRIVCPELGQTYSIPNADVLSLKVDWEKNAPISFSLRLKNFAREYTKNTGDFYDLITKGEWSALRGTRKYVYIRIASIDGYGNKTMKYFPQLVILGTNGDSEIEVQGVDRISYVLFKRKSWDAFCFRDSCVETDLYYGKVQNTLTVTASSGQNPFSENNSGYLFSIDRSKATLYSTMPSTEGVIIRYTLNGSTWENVIEFYLRGYIPQAATLSEDGTYLYLFANNKPTKKFIAATLHYMGNSDTYTEEATELIHSGKYVAPNLTLQYYDKYKGSRFSINASEAVENTDFTYESNTYKYILDSKYIPKTSSGQQSQETRASYPIASIFAVNPISSKALIRMILEKACNDIYDIIEVDEEIANNLMHRDFWIESTLQADGVTAISIIEEILQAIVGVWKIIPLEDKLIFQTQDAVLADELPTRCDFVTPEKLTRSINVSNNESNAINTVNVIRPSIIEKKYVEVLPSNVQGETTSG